MTYARLTAPLIQLSQVGRNRRRLTLRIQIFVALGGGDVVLEPVVAVLSVKPHIKLVAGRLDE